MAVRYVTPVPPRKAAGTVARVYAQLSREFGFHAPSFTALSPAPDLLVATWAVLRESLLAGEVSRADKEVVAAGVSRANRCPFCVDAHVMMLHAAAGSQVAETIARGETPADPGHARLLAWAMDHRAAPIPAELTAEHIGTALAFHFINRMVSALLTEDVLPGGLQKRRLVRRLAGRIFAPVVRRSSLPLLESSRPMLIPVWAGNAPVGTAFSGLRAAATGGRTLLSHDAEAMVRDVVNAWDGGPPPLSGGWLTEPLAALRPVDRPAAKLALLAALAPYRITDGDVAAWRGTGRADADLVRLLGFGAFTAVARVEEWIVGAASPRRRSAA